MIDKILFSLADWHNEILRKHGIITKENYSDIDYIFRSNIWNFFTTLFTIIIGYAFGILPEISMLFLVFNVLRDKCGGWHSYGNLTYCFVSSTAIFIAISLFCEYILVNVNIFLLMAISFACIIYTFIKTPIMIEEDKYQDDWQFKFDYLVLSIVFVVTGYFSGYMNCVTSAIFLVALYMSNFCEKINIRIRRAIFKNL